jgi:ABC-type nitrate/sulfonate/bicarbonate transport system substrate-binding protein
MHDILRVVVFEGVQNLPIYAAQEQGYFARHGLDVHLTFTPNSWTLRDGLAAGTFDVAHTAVDNAIAMITLAGADVTVVLGGDPGFNAVITQDDVPSLASLRGERVLVDAKNTAFALVLYKVMAQSGLAREDYRIESVGATPLRLQRMLQDRSARAAIMNLPYRIQAARSGLRVLAEATDIVGPYLSTAAFVMRPWAQANRELLVRYIAAYLQGLRWALDVGHEALAAAMLARRLSLSDDVARECLAMVTATGSAGLSSEGVVDLVGLANVLRLRAEIEGQWGGVQPDPTGFVDDSYRAAALARLDAGAVA